MMTVTIFFENGRKETILNVTNILNHIDNSTPLDITYIYINDNEKLEYRTISFNNDIIKIAHIKIKMEVYKYV